MRTLGLAITQLLLVVALSFPVSSMATIYSYIDESGVVHFSNVPTEPQYRPVVRLDPRPGFGERTGQILIPAYSGDWQPHPDSYDQLIRKAASRYLVDPHLVKAVIRCESNFDYLAVSRKGAVGLMQLMPDTVADMEVTDPFDPQDNINGGTRYLRKMMGLFKGNLRMALAAYNAGPTTVINVGGVPRWRETVTYVQKVQYYYQVYQKDSPQIKGWARVD
jgi:soluble lytic murein transglycosylase-like protein